MWQVDTVICCGATTSGCVRATEADALSHGYAVQVISDCTFDRGEASYVLSYFDVSQKDPDLRTATEVEHQLRSIDRESCDGSAPAPTEAR